MNKHDMAIEIVSGVLKELASRKGCNIENIVGYDVDIMDEIINDLLQVVLVTLEQGDE